MLPGGGGMRLPPASVVASWPTPNYADPVTRGNALLIVNVIFQGLATIAVAGRLYSRYIKKWFGIDDVLIVLGYVFDIALTTVIMLAKDKYGWNRHEWDLPRKLYSPASKIVFAAKILFGPTVTFIRLSLIAFYYRLVRESGVKWFKWVLHVSAVYTVLVCFAFIITAIVQCSPTQAYWIYPPRGGHCLDEGKVLLGCGVTNSISDLLTTVLPIPIIARLQMPLRQRIGIGLLLCTGIFVTIAGAARIYFTWDSLIASYDETWRAYPLWIATAVEVHLALICACAPAWRPLLQGPMSKVFARVSSSAHLSSTAPKAQTTTKRTRFNPLKSIAWFQHARFDFERTKRDRNIGTLTEKSSWLPILTEGANPTDGRHYEISGGPIQSEIHGYGILVRKSIDISSVHITEPPPERPDAPLSWIWHKRGTPIDGHYPSDFV